MVSEPKRSTSGQAEVREPATLLDASALLALLQNEAGATIVVRTLPTALISAANLSEVIAKLVQKGVPEKQATGAVRAFDLQVLPVNEAVAIAAGELAKEGKSLGLSLGDRICLATGRIENLPILTTDQQWLALPKIYQVITIR